MVCGVRLISGTNTNASLPWHTTSSIAQINLGFAAAGDAVQEERLETAAVQRRLQLRPDAQLILIQSNRGRLARLVPRWRR